MLQTISHAVLYLMSHFHIFLMVEAGMNEVVFFFTAHSVLFSFVFR